MQRSGLLLVLALASGTSAEEATSPTGFRLLGHDKGHLAIVAVDGRLEWELPWKHQAHDLTLLPNGNVLAPIAANRVVEVTPSGDVVWSYEAKPVPPYDGKIEIHAVQRLDDGVTVVAETGNRRLVEVDPDGNVIHTVPLTVDNPHPHRDTRLVRKLESGNYLVCHEADGCVREYDFQGRVVWSYKLDLAGRPRSPGHGPEGHGTEVYGAYRLPNGNTMIACGNGNRVIEVTPEGKTVWSLEHDELPGIRLAWVTTLHILPSGNIIVGNCHAGPDNPQLFEVTRDKRVVRTFKNLEIFGNSLASVHVLDLPPGTIR